MIVLDFGWSLADIHANTVHNNISGQPPFFCFGSYGYDRSHVYVSARKTMTCEQKQHFDNWGTTTGVCPLWFHEPEGGIKKQYLYIYIYIHVYIHIFGIHINIKIYNNNHILLHI